NRARRQPDFFTIQVGNRKRRLKRTDPSGFRVAGQELDDVLAREQRESGFVLNGTLRQLRGGVIAQLDVEFVPDVLNGDSVIVFDFSDEIDERPLRAATARQRQLAAWNLH